jgi:hypothetical protein
MPSKVTSKIGWESEDEKQSVRKDAAKTKKSLSKYLRDLAAQARRK